MTATDNELIPQTPEEENGPKQSVVSRSAGEVEQLHRIIRFRNRPMVLEAEPFPHFVPLHKEKFEKLGYAILGGISRSRMNDVFAYLSNTAEDLTAKEDLVLFGVPPQHVTVQADTDIAALHAHRPKVWDMDRLEWTVSEDPEGCIWRSPHPPIALPDAATRLEFVMQLAGQDKELYDDIMQSIAPLVMKRKPDGVIWWVGDGANGKSTLMDALYRIFPGQLASLTVKRVVDERDTPSLNGHLANVVKESSEGRVEDTEIYKAIGTHEDFWVHKFHSQDSVQVRGNMHHIFSANNIPAFNDKGHSARRRTFIIPFGQRFDSDPTFEERTFTPEFFGQLITEMCKYAKQLERQQYRYKWSAATLAAKADYDSEANNAEEYAKYIVTEGIMAFEGYSNIQQDYQNWCMDMGYVALGIGNLKRAMKQLGFERISTRMPGAEKPRNIYRIPDNPFNDLQPMGLGRPGLFTVPGFQKVEPEEVLVPAFNEPNQPDDVPEEEPERTPEPAKKTVLNGKW